MKEKDILLHSESSIGFFYAKASVSLFVRFFSLSPLPFFRVFFHCDIPGNNATGYLNHNS
jgi:hypothetical protein